MARVRTSACFKVGVCSQSRNRWHAFFHRQAVHHWSRCSMPYTLRHFFASPRTFLVPVDTRGGDATIRWDFRTGGGCSGGGGCSVKLRDRLRTGERVGMVEVAAAQLMLVNMCGDTGIWMDGNAWYAWSAWMCQKELGADWLRALLGRWDSKGVACSRMRASGLTGACWMTRGVEPTVGLATGPVGSGGGSSFTCISV